MLVEMARRASGRPLGSSGTIAAVNAASSDAYRSAGGGAWCKAASQRSSWFTVPVPMSGRSVQGCHSGLTTSRARMPPTARGTSRRRHVHLQCRERLRSPPSAGAWVLRAAYTQTLRVPPRAP